MHSQVGDGIFLASQSIQEPFGRRCASAGPPSRGVLLPASGIAEMHHSTASLRAAAQHHGQSERIPHPMDMLRHLAMIAFRKSAT